MIVSKKHKLKKKYYTLYNRIKTWSVLDCCLAIYMKKYHKAKEEL
jgi:hypothetical protein